MWRKVKGVLSFGIFGIRQNFGTERGTGKKNDSDKRISGCGIMSENMRSGPPIPDAMFSCNIYLFISKHKSAKKFTTVFTIQLYGHLIPLHPQISILMQGNPTKSSGTMRTYCVLISSVKLSCVNQMIKQSTWFITLK